MRHHAFPSLSRAGALTAALLLGTAPAAASAQRALEAEVYASGFQGSVLAISPPGDRDRLFVVEQRGLIHIIENGVLLGTPYLDITQRTNRSGEQGLLGLAFHPDYATNGWIFVHYTNTNGNTRLDRYTVDANDPNVIDVASRVNLLKVNQPYANHNGGMIEFGADGYLYMGLGDGGAAGDPGNRAQDGQTLLGKMLRLDVSTNPYTIPADNPFVNDPNVLDEIWSLGLRNPWRFGFDRATGDLWIGDVGQNEWEEVDYEPAGAGGRNYGWRIMEGTHCYNPSSGCNQTGLTLPVHEYSHGGNPFRCSITGGWVYRGEALATMQGRYFFADYCSGQVWSFRLDANQQKIDFVDHSGELGTLGSIVSFGQDAAGELYVLNEGGTVYRLRADGLRLAATEAVAGASIELTIEEATPSSTAYLGYSLRGLGTTSVPALGVDADLDDGQLLTPLTTDASGRAQLAGRVPLALKGLTVWLQALENGAVSNVVVQTVQ